MDLFLQMLINGATVGGTYALAAIGISLIFGILNIINFGHGAALTIGAYVAMVMLRYLGLDLVLSFAVAVASSFLTGYLIERIAVRPLVGAPILMPLISTLGIGIALENVVQFIFGPQTQPFPTEVSHEPFMLGGATVSVWELATMIVTVITIAALHMLLHHTRFGTAVRAIAEDRRTAALLGIDVDRTIVITFCIASALGGLAGVLSAALYNTIDPVMGSAAMLKAFAASVLGGMEVVAGAIIGGLVLGIAESATSIYVSTAWRDGVALILLVLVLLFKPTGLLGQRSLEKVERQSLTVLPLPPVPAFKLAQPWFWIGLAIALALPLIFRDLYSQRILTVMLLFGTLALSLNLIAGFAGIISLAHASFYGIGAYVSALLTTTLGLPVFVGFTAAVAFAGLFGIAFAWPVMRLARPLCRHGHAGHGGRDLGGDAELDRAHQRPDGDPLDPTARPAWLRDRGRRLLLSGPGPAGGLDRGGGGAAG